MDKIKTRKGTTWTGSRIRQILINPLPCGYIIWHKTQERKFGDEVMTKYFNEEEWQFIPVEKKWEKYYKPIISKKLFNRAQKMRKGKVHGRTITSKNILAGTIKCPKCHAPMVETSYYKVKKYPYRKGYYICSKNWNKKECVGERFRSWEIKSLVLDNIRRILDNPQSFQEYLDDQKPNNTMEIMGLKNKLDNWRYKAKKAAERIKVLNLKYIDEKIKETYYFELLKELEEKAVLCSKKINDLNNEINLAETNPMKQKSLEQLSHEIKGRFNNLDEKQQKSIVRVLIDKIIPITKGVGAKEDLNIVYNYPAIIEHSCADPKLQLNALLRLMQIYHKALVVCLALIQV